MTRIVSYEPAVPHRAVAEVEALNAGELDSILETVRDGARLWSRDASARLEGLQFWADRIREDAAPLSILVAREVGKTIREARAEVSRAEAIIRYYAQAVLDPLGEIHPGAKPGSRVSVERVPVGVVAAICPWNFPVAIPAWKLAPALAYGNGVVFKPAAAAIGVATRLVELSRPGIPEEVLAIAPLTVGGATSLVDDSRVSAVSFTGSTIVGRSIVGRVAARGAAVQAEMGGQNASIVLADADLDLAAATIADAAMGYAGQKCTATSRILVVDEVYNDFVQQLKANVEALLVGDPLSEETAMGPVINEEARATIERRVQAAKQRGARSVTEEIEVPATGWFMGPTLLAINDRRDPFVQQETFGPAAAILRVSDEGDAIAVANATRYGLSTAVFGSDLSRAMGVARRLESGMIRINASTTGADYWVPFGGEKESSYGPREQGKEVLAFYSKSRTITVTQGWNW